MNWSDSLRLRITSELKGYDVYFSVDDVPLEVDFPKQWLGFGFLDSEKRHIPVEWADFSEFLPWVSAWLDKCVLGTVLAVSDRPYLMYVYGEGGDLYFYMGGAPLGVEGSDLDSYPSLPASFRQFYSRLHNGFGFYIGCTMGPSRLEDFVPIKDLCDEDYPTLPDMLGVFSSGAGNYLALGDGPFKGKAFIWWHEKSESPTEGIDLWNVMDSWMSIFLENSDSNEYC
ncbi:MULTISPECIES: SMI1/KNR4 family protein [Pseudomonas]|uniref:SMI1/KNR4 family protein n=1 Tax=Pseudomonas TaxID=286 RepID=UPI000FB7879E|nr:MULTISPECIES: SMI1/KNR4 family protein [Pseudomonas]QNV67650.1 hypothetical protein F7661_18575 [Pseudomonas sp. CFA]WPE27257.1 hypothetical protein PshuTeo1_29790 [Pseudomonas hunanensis]MCX2817563.1 hypothetical protein [Pseudomonas sp. DCB_E]MCX9145330.1 hypothetical protein [Pseudomonas sp. DCB_Q]MDD2007510.1 hypothetical protein [Pseudomonas putida]